MRRYERRPAPEEFIEGLLREHEAEIRRRLRKGAYKVQIDFTEARLAMKIDPSGSLLNSFIDRNNLALARFSDEERKRIGVHTCPAGDRDSTHSADVDYAELLPSLFEMKVGKVPAIALTAFARSDDRTRALRAGFLVHVSKPVEPSELVVTVATVAGRTGDPTTA